MYSGSISYAGYSLFPALLIVLFGYYLHQNRWPAFLCLTAALLLFSRWIWKASFEEIRRILGFNRHRMYWLLYGAILGIGLAMLLRWDQARMLYPWPLRPFLVMAVLVGLTEEILFRGWFYGLLFQWRGAPLAIAVTALLHTAYKVAIFIPAGPIGELLFLGSVTCCAGLILGYWRKAAGSIFPCLVFHALFDLWIYGDQATPWWVW